MANYTVTDTELTDIADAIIAKAGLSGQLEFPDDFVDGIEGISTGTDVSDTTAVEADVRAGKYFHKADGSKVQGSIADQAAQTIHPSTTDQTIASGKHLAGAQTIKGVLLTNLDAGNIKKDVVVKVGDSTDDDCVTSVTGTYEGSGGGTQVEPNDVNFYDYDGTILHSYSASDFANLTEMPPNPSRNGYISQGWNWSLSDAKAYVAKNMFLEIGQMYKFDNTDVKVHLQIWNGATKNIKLQIPANNSTARIIDWGDGTIENIGTGNRIAKEHTYATYGKYIVTISNIPNLGSDSYGSIGTYDGKKIVEVNFPFLPGYVCDMNLKTVCIPKNDGNDVSIALNTMYQLDHVTLPTNVKPGALTGCGARSISIPSTHTGNVSCYGCQRLKFISIPNGSTSIGNNAYRDCRSLERITIPENIASIGTCAFQDCASLTVIRFKPATPPTIQSNTFTNLYSKCVFIVPLASLSAYQTANIWSNYASKMVGE